MATHGGSWADMLLGIALSKIQPSQPMASFSETVGTRRKHNDKRSKQSYVEKANIS